MPLPPFQRLVDAYWRDVARLAHALVGRDEGDDVAQQAWTQAYAAYPSVRSSANLRGWLLTITHRCAMDAHRARRRRPTPVDDGPLHASAARTPAAAADAALPEALLWQRVGALPDRQRQAVLLRYVADLEHRDIARALGTTATASRRLVSDGLATLRRDLT